jgi:mRNA-degrading endonuclease RelE of RelBE toxin-antitoxin system
MRTVAESPDFQKRASKFWSEPDYDSFIDWIARNPESGVVIPNSGGLRKVRWSRQGTGKSAGVRIIYGIRSDSVLVLLLIYAKSENENVMPRDVKGDL